MAPGSRRRKVVGPKTGKRGPSYSSDVVQLLQSTTYSVHEAALRGRTECFSGAQAVANHRSEPWWGPSNGSGLIWRESESGAAFAGKASFPESRRFFPLDLTSLSSSIEDCLTSNTVPLPNHNPTHHQSPLLFQSHSQCSALPSPAARARLPAASTRRRPPVLPARTRSFASAEPSRSTPPRRPVSSLLHFPFDALTEASPGPMDGNVHGTA